MKKTVLFIFALSLTGSIFAQYLPHYSTYTLHPFQINPAYMGSYTETKGSLLYKNQWAGFDGAPTISTFDVGIPIGNKKNVVGLDFIDDRIGLNINQQVSLNYGYKLKLDNTKNLAFGLGLALRMMRSTLGDATTQQSGDPQFWANTPNLTAPNFKFGLYYYTSDFYAGFAIPNMLHSKVVSDMNEGFDAVSGFRPAETHYFLHAGLKKKVSDEFELHPSMLIKHIAGAPTQFDINMNVIFTKVMGIGLSYRTQNVFVVMAHYKINDYIHLGYGFNHNFSELSVASSNSHEVTLIYTIGKGRKFGLDVPRF